MAETVLLRSTADRSLTTHNKLGQFGLDAAIGSVPSHLSCSHALLSLGHVLKKKKSGIGMHLSNYNLFSFLVPEKEVLGNQTYCSHWNPVSSSFHSCLFPV